MLFGLIYTARDGVTEDMEKRSLGLFTQWSPPFEFKAHYARGDGQGGIAIVESDTAEAIVEGTAPWQPFFSFELTPVVDIQAAVPLFQRAYQWRDSVG
jgi:Protein of unknown function (DUF3303)